MGTFLLLSLLLRGRIGFRPEELSLLILCICLMAVYAALFVCMGVSIQVRQVVNLSGLTGPWLGLGLSLFLHRLWLRRPWLQTAFIVAGAATLVWLGTLISQTRHVREVAQAVLSARGPGLRILSSSAQVPYFAKGEFLPLPVYTIQGHMHSITTAELAEISRQSRADVIYADYTAQWWCPELWEKLGDPQYLDQVAFFVERDPKRPKNLWAMLDARKFVAIEAPPDATAPFAPIRP